MRATPSSRRSPALPSTALPEPRRQLFIFRYLKAYTLFLMLGRRCGSRVLLPLADPIQDLLGLGLPIRTKAVLLPFTGKILSDGLQSSYRVSLGPGWQKAPRDVQACQGDRRDHYRLAWNE